MATRERRAARLLLAAAGIGAAACSVSNLSFREVERDLDAIVRLEADGDEQRLVYVDEARQASTWTKAAMLNPIRPVLMWLLDATESKELENPSQSVRDLLEVLPDKAGDDLVRGAVSAQRLTYVLHLDPSPLNRIFALDGLAVLARAHGFGLLDGVGAGAGLPQPAPELIEWIDVFKQLRPAARTPVGAPLAADDARRYDEVLAAMSARPLPTWRQRLALVADLVAARSGEGDRAMSVATAGHLRAALRHLLQTAVVEAVQGQAPEQRDVRMRALELLHRDGGPDSVPVLLALMANSPARIRAGEPQFDDDTLMQLRLIHICGQLDRRRGEQVVTLPGREDWQRTSPLDFLARIVLRQDAFLSPLTLPAREALALSLGRREVELYELDDAWVAEWYDEFRQRS